MCRTLLCELTLDNKNQSWKTVILEQKILFCIGRGLKKNRHFIIFCSKDLGGMHSAVLFITVMLQGPVLGPLAHRTESNQERMAHFRF